MSEPLDSVPNGSDVLIDVNIFVFGITNQSPQCKNFLARCSSEQVYGITLFEVVNDATHLFMLGEARKKNPKKVREFLENNPEEVKKLTAYWTETERILALNLIFLQCEEKIVTGAHKERLQSGLLTNDSVIVATMREYGISKIATHDAGFDSVAGLSVFRPNDI